MTVSPPSSNAMCSETNVTVTSLQIRRTSSNEYSKEPTTPLHDNPSSRGDTAITLAPIQSQRTTSPGDGIGNAEDGQIVGSRVPERKLDHVKVVTFEGISNDANGLDQSGDICNLTLEECSKLVPQISRELAVLHSLSRGIGGDSDSGRLREELRLSRQRICSLAQQTAAGLVPLLRNKTSLRKDEAQDVEKLYRIFSGCLEYLNYMMLKVRSLLTTFQINQDSCCFIQTGISDPVGFIIKSSCTLRDVSSGQSSLGEESTSQTEEDVTRLVGEMKAMQQLLYAVNSACDVQPWDVGEEPGKTSDNSHRSKTRTVTFDSGLTRRQRLLKMVAAVVTVLVIIAVAIVVTVLTTS